MRGPRLLLAALSLAALGGCVAVEETFHLASNGKGTYALKVRWDADLLHRVTGLLGSEVVSRLEGRAFPLDPEAWRDGLKDLEGVKIVSLEARDAGAGMREIALVLSFERLEALFQWELLARRDVSVRLLDPGSGLPRSEGRAEEGDEGVVEMAPFTRVPFLDSLARAWAAREEPPDPAIDERERDPLGRLGLDRREVDLVATLLAPRLEQIALATRFEVAGAFVSVDATGSEPSEDPGTARLRLTFRDLVDGAPRRLKARWRPLFLDVVPAFERRGDAEPTSRGGAPGGGAGVR